MSKSNHDTNAKKPATDNAAVNLIRSKINNIYSHEPEAKEEITEINEHPQHLSKHQQYMRELSKSGRSLAEIQTAWHEYYQNLTDAEKHEVWQEFYKANKKAKAKQNQVSSTNNSLEHPPKEGKVYHDKSFDQPSGKRSVADLKKQIKRNTGNNKKRLSAQENFKSLLFGLGMGSITLIVLLFSFFNERFLAPFITPSKNLSSAPVIIDPNSTVAGPNPTITIPKINVEVPVVYDVESIEEKDIQKGLEKGVVHYATTSNPGEKGNVVIVGHSSNNLFNSGKYKFAFVLLNRLEVGDTFSLTKNGKRYVYKIYEKKIVKPTDVSVLEKTSRTATATLITCDPPGTTINRLVIHAEQILPDPVKNIASTAKTTASAPQIVPGNAESLWSRLVSWLSN